MEIVDSFYDDMDQPRVGKYRLAQVPFSELLDGQKRRVYRGTDFSIKPTSLRAYLYEYAQEHGIRVHVVLDEQQGTVAFQFYELEGLQAADQDTGWDATWKDELDAEIEQRSVDGDDVNADDDAKENG